MKKKYTRGYRVSQLLGIIALVCAFIILGTNYPTAGAILCMVGFMLLWFPTMLPDHEKYQAPSWDDNEYEEKM